MKRRPNILILALVALGIATMAAIAAMPSAQAQTQTGTGRYTVVFYNQENLYDTIKSPGVADDEFTPTGAKQWTGSRYWKKIDNMTEVFYQMAKEQKAWPTIIGVSEVENRNVLEDLVGSKKMLNANYQIVHYDSPDARGVDVALFYRPDQFKYEGSEPLTVTLPDNRPTRDVLMVWGRIEGELFYFFVNHWPSRFGGQKASEPRRVAAAMVVRHAIDSLALVVPDLKVVVMGDLNDDPVDASMLTALGAVGAVKDVQTGPGGMFNPFYEMFKKGFGTLAYQDAWNLFDNIIVNYNLLHGTPGHLALQKSGKFYGNIFNRPFLRQTEGQYKGYPLRTFVGNTFQAGFSDHFPVYILIGK